MIATDETHSIRVWEVVNRRFDKLCFSGQSSSLLGIAFDTDGTRLVSAGWDAYRASVGYAEWTQFTSQVVPTNSIDEAFETDNAAPIWPVYKSKNRNAVHAL